MKRQRNGVNKGFTNDYEWLYNKGLSNPDHEAERVMGMARERYLWNVEEDHIHDPGKERKITTKKQKLANFWFYHKWHIVACIVCIALAYSYFYSVFTQEKPDYEIAMIGSYTEEDTEKIRDAITSVAEDRNGDGQILVSINQYSSANMLSGQTPNVAKLITDLSSFQSIIYIMDERDVELQQTQNPSMFAYADGSMPPADATDYHHIGILWKDCPLLSSIDFTAKVIGVDGEVREENFQSMFQQLKVCIRSRNFDENNKEIAQKYEDHWNLYQKITGS